MIHTTNQRGRSSIVKMGMFIGDVNQAQKPGCNQWTMDVSRIFLRRYLPRGQPWTGVTLKKCRFKPENKINICLYIGVYRVYYKGFGEIHLWVGFNVWPCGDTLPSESIWQMSCTGWTQLVPSALWAGSFPGRFSEMGSHKKLYE